MQVSVPYGVALLNQETVPASAGLMASELFPGGVPSPGRADDTDFDVNAQDLDLTVPGQGLGLKIFLGVLLFFMVLFGGIVGGYHLLELITGPPTTPNRGLQVEIRPGRARAVKDRADSGREGGSQRERGAEGSTDKAVSGRRGRSSRKPGPCEIRIVLKSVPQDAEVFQDVMYVGQTNIVLIKKRKRRAKLRFTFRKEGYRDQKRSITLDKSQTILVRLRRK